MKMDGDQLLRWWKAAASRFFKIPEESIGAGATIPVKWSKRELIGLKTGINDLLTMTRHGSYRIIEPIDRELRALGLPTFAEMEKMLERKEAAILRRALIRDDEEYYIAKELLDGLDSDLTPKQRAKLGTIAAAYESKAAEPGATDNPDDA
jgi:hypothetical protein